MIYMKLWCIMFASIYATAYIFTESEMAFRCAIVMSLLAISARNDQRDDTK